MSIVGILVFTPREVTYEMAVDKVLGVLDEIDDVDTIIVMKSYINWIEDLREAVRIRGIRVKLIPYVAYGCYRSIVKAIRAIADYVIAVNPGLFNEYNIANAINIHQSGDVIWNTRRTNR